MVMKGKEPQMELACRKRGLGLTGEVVAHKAWKNAGQLPVGRAVSALDNVVSAKDHSHLKAGGGCQGVVYKP